MWTSTERYTKIASSTYYRQVSLLSERSRAQTREDCDGETTLSLPSSRLHASVVPSYPTYKGRLPAINQQVLEMSLNASGVRDMARVLQISTSTIIKTLKKGDWAHRSAYATVRHLVSAWYGRTS